MKVLALATGLTETGAASEWTLYLNSERRKAAVFEPSSVEIAAPPILLHRVAAGRNGESYSRV